MLSSGHQGLCGAKTWMEASGADSVSFLSLDTHRWRKDSWWGEDVGEPPWELIREFDSGCSLDGSACSKRAALRGAGQCSAALVSLGEGRLAWVTSRRPSWVPTEALKVALGWWAAAASEAPARSVDMRSQHAATAAHDIRNQLSLALLRLEQLDETTGAEIGAVRGTLRSGRALCNAFLEGSEPHADLALRPLLMEEIRGALDGSMERAVHVSLRCGAKVFVHASESAVRRFAQNALMNGLEASPAGSELVMEVVHHGRGAVELAVDDHGAGLSAEQVAHAFTCGRSGRDSTGLGSESLIQAAAALGSALWVESSPRCGTRVSVRMQATRSERPVAVLMDTDPLLRLLTRARLEELGWWVVASDRSEAAISALDRWSAALAVSRRGACDLATLQMGEVAADLGIPWIQLTAGDEGRALPAAPAD